MVYCQFFASVTLYPKNSVRLKSYDKHLFHLFSFLGIWIFVSTWTLLARVDWVTSVQVEIGSAAAAGKSLSRARLCATPWTAAHQAPPSMGFSRQEYWSWGDIAFSRKLVQFGSTAVLSARFHMCFFGTQMEGSGSLGPALLMAGHQSAKTKRHWTSRCKDDAYVISVNHPIG